MKCCCFLQPKQTDFNGRKFATIQHPTIRTFFPSLLLLLLWSRLDSSGFSFFFFIGGALRSFNILHFPHLPLPLLFCVHLDLVFVEEWVLVECLHARLSSI